MNDNKLLNQIGDLMDNKLQPVKRLLSGVGKRFDGVEKWLGRVEKRVDGVDKRLGGTEKRLDGVEKRLGGVQKQLDTVELKVELVNKKVDAVNKELQQSIRQAQEETIETLSELIHNGYNLHEKRIKKIKDTLQITNPRQ